MRKRALALARDAHHDQRRDLDGRPFVEHPMQVAALLVRTGAGEEVLAAALLHDVVERSDVSVSEIESQFGAEVSRLVTALTEDERIEDYEERKAAHREQIVAAGRDAATIFAADKLAKAIELRRVMHGSHKPKIATAMAKFRHYERTAEALARHFPRLPLLADLRGELERVRVEQPALRLDVGGRVPSH